MNFLTNILQLFSAVAFIGYGLSCLFTEHMALEFQRYGLSKFRKLTGFFELLGGLGLLVGFYFQDFTVFPALGLTVLMALGVWTRFRVGDSFVSALPAIILFLTNLFILIAA